MNCAAPFAARITGWTGLSIEQQAALCWTIADAMVVVLWENLHGPAFGHSLGAYWTWYVGEVLLAFAFFFLSFRWLIATDGHRQRVSLASWAVLVLLVSWRLVVMTEQVAGILRPLMYQ